MPDFIAFTIQVNDKAIQEMLIAQLAAAGTDGFEEEKNILKAFVSAENCDQHVIQQILADAAVTYTSCIIKETNWNADWEANFQPVQVGNFCCIRADFHPKNPLAQHDIIITPKMSFGTGHHATTWLMVQAMEQLVLAGKKVFDFGTGTGILAILAEKCGAAQVVAIDNDDWSITNTTENLNSNHCHNVLINKAEGFLSDLRYDVVLANINRNIILLQLLAIQQHLVKNGVVLLSGLLTGDEGVVVDEAFRCGFTLVHKSEMSGWICLLMANS